MWAANCMTQQEQKVTSNPLVVRRKVPISLSVVSYIFFTIGLLGAIGGFTTLAVAQTDLPLSPLMSLLLGILYLFLSRGLRRCSRGWHICALIVGSFGLILTVFRAVRYFLSLAVHSTDTLPYGFLLALIFTLSVQVWIIQVLTRADIRRLFYGSPDHAT